MSFSVVSEIFLFWVGVQISPFLQLGPKSAHPKKRYTIGVSANFFWKKHMRHETAIVGPKPKQPKSRNSSYHLFVIYFACFLLFQQHKHNKNAETPIFVVF